MTLTKQIMRKEYLMAHAAGIVDGEGCFGIVRKPGMNTFFPTVQVVMTNKKPLDQLLGLFGGSISAHKNDGKYKQAYHYSISCNGAVKLAVAMERYLIEKREQAQAIIALGKNIQEWNSINRLRGNLPEEVVKHRADLKARVLSLKDSPVLIAPSRNLKKRELVSYLAGILEAEGCFSILRESGNCFRSVVTVQMRCSAILSELSTFFGGTIIAVKKPNSPTHKPIFMWRVTGRAAANLCRAVSPFLSFRHEEADLLRQLQATTDLWAKRVGRGGMPSEITEKRVRWMSRIHDIHSPNRARAETKSESAERRSDSPICIELLDAGLTQAASA